MFVCIQCFLYCCKVNSGDIQEQTNNQKLPLGYSQNLKQKLAQELRVAAGGS